MRYIILFALIVISGNALAGGACIGPTVFYGCPTQTNNQTNNQSNNQANSQSTSQSVSTDNSVTLNDPGNPSHVSVREAPPIALGGFAGSFSSDYCGGTAQAGISFMGGAISGGHPVFDANCQALRVAEKTFQLASMLSTQAEHAYQSGAALSNHNAAYNATDAAMGTAVLSEHLTQAGINVLCGISPEVRNAYTQAGVTCGPAK